MENDIEEARERLEKRIKDIWFSTTYSQEQEEKDLKILLLDYKRVLKENEELKEERQIVGIPVKNKKDGKIGIVLHQWESGSVAVLENINPRVINTHDSWNTLEIVTDKAKQTQTKCETIPIQKIKDKIRKNEEIIDISNNGDLIHELLQKNKVYEELLESEK